MTNFANSMRSEIARVARKETKADIRALRNAVSTHRSEIAALKKQLKEMQTALKRVTKEVASNIASQKKLQSTQSPPSEKNARTSFGPAKFLEHRKMLGITQAQMAKLLDASTLSVHKWEAGSVVPRTSQLVKIAEILKLGKREALKRLGS